MKAPQSLSVGQLHTLVMTSLLLFPSEETAQPSSAPPPRPPLFLHGWRRSALVSEAQPQNFMARTLFYSFLLLGGMVFKFLSHMVEQTFDVFWEAPECGGKTPLEGTQDHGEKGKLNQS